ncbi:MAG: mandelate racemase/muconate lactonizing enzyme family protein [Nitriliruptorales bacterium]|nr:mandelate racemase/muconate lactonizing enzyme family protein [Nitriliruptorales bacterium]
MTGAGPPLQGSNVKIARVETVPIRQELDRPFGSAQGWTTARQYLIVRVVADDGTVGYGECWGPIAGNQQVVEQIIAPMLEGEDPCATGRLWQRVAFKLRWAYHSFSPYSALSGVDLALWDLRGKLAGEPVHRLLGGACHERVSAYATGHYFRQVDRLDEQIAIVLDEAQANLGKGFRRLKLKIGLRLLGWGADADVALIRAVRERLGDDVPIMVDANCAYDVPTALRVGRACEDLGIGWFEEPLPPADLDGYAELSRKLDVPIAGGESWALLARFAEVFQRRAVSVAQPDVCSAGGITETKRIADLAAALNIRCIPHVWGTPIAIAASLQVAATLPQEVLLEYDQSDNPIRERLATEPFRLDSDGAVAVPQRPGLGIDLDEDELERFRWDPR